MSVPIGLSFGDLVAAVKLIKEAIASVRASGGAAEDYLRTVTKLEQRLVILQTISEGESAAGHSTYTTAIRSITQSIGKDVNELLLHVQRHEVHLGTPARSSSVKTIFDKVRWGAHESKYVAVKRKDVTDDLATISLLFDLDMSTRLATIEHQGNRTLEVNNEQNQRLSAALASLDALSNEQKSLHAAIASIPTQLRSIQSMGQRVLDITEPREPSVEHYSMSMDGIITSRFSRASLRGPENSRPDIFNGAINNLPDMTNHGKKPDAVDLIFTGSQNLAAGLLSLLVELVKAVIHSVIPLVHWMPTFSMYLRVIRAIPSTVSLMVSDNIELTDALGTKHSLQFQGVRNWDVFHSMLKNRFQDRPGSEKVAAGQFRVLKSTASNTILDETTWAEELEPGDHLVMSIEISKLRRTPRRGHCLRGSCNGMLRKSIHGGFECSSCSLYCHEEQAARARRQPTLVHGPQDLRAEVARTTALMTKLGWIKTDQGKWIKSNGTQNESFHPKFTKKIPRNRVSYEAVRSGLAQCLAQSHDRAQRREKKGWTIQSRQIARLRQELERKEESELVEQEQRELSLFIRVHIGVDLYKPALLNVDYVQAWFHVPPPIMIGEKQIYRSLVDIVMEDDSTWAPACLASAIRNGAEVDSVDPCYGTALQAAALFGCLVKTSILLEHGADPLAYSVAHQSAIHAAAIHDHEDVLALLLKSTHEGIDYDATNPEAVNRILLFRSTCTDALRCATLRGCNSAILSLLEYTDEVHVKTAIASSNESTKSIIVGEAHRNGALTMGECMDLLIQEGPDYDLLL